MTMTLRAAAKRIPDCARGSETRFSDYLCARGSKLHELARDFPRCIP